MMEGPASIGLARRACRASLNESAAAGILYLAGWDRVCREGGNAGDHGGFLHAVAIVGSSQYGPKHHAGATEAQLDAALSKITTWQLAALGNLDFGFALKLPALSHFPQVCHCHATACALFTSPQEVSAHSCH